MTKTYPLNVGLKVILDTYQTVANATKLEIHVKRPDDTTVIWTAAPLDVAPAEWTTELKLTAAQIAEKLPRCIMYLTASSDFNIPGNYYLMAYAEWGAGSKHHGETARIQIYADYT